MKYASNDVDRYTSLYLSYLLSPWGYAKIWYYYVLRFCYELLIHNNMLSTFFFFLRLPRYILYFKSYYYCEDDSNDFITFKLYTQDVFLECMYAWSEILSKPLWIDIFHAYYYRLIREGKRRRNDCKYKHSADFQRASLRLWLYANKLDTDGNVETFE